MPPPVMIMPCTLPLSEEAIKAYAMRSVFEDKDGNQVERTFVPLEFGWREKGGRPTWCVFAWDVVKRDVRTFALDQFVTRWVKAWGAPRMTEVAFYPLPVLSEEGRAMVNERIHAFNGGLIRGTLVEAERSDEHAAQLSEKDDPQP